MNAQEISTLLKRYDDRAVVMKKRFINYSWLAGIICGLAAVVIFAGLVAFHDALAKGALGVILPTAELILVAASFILLSYVAPKTKLRFLQNRHWAEYLRIHELFAKNHLPLFTDSIDYKNGLKKAELKHFTIPDDVREWEKKYAAKSHKGVDLPKAKHSLNSFVKHQQKYHTTIRIKGYKAKEHRLETALKVILYFFLGIVFAKFVFELMEHAENPFMHEYLFLLQSTKFLVILLPPLYATLEGINYFSEWKRNILVSEAVHLEYELLKQELEASNEETALKNATQKLYEVFITEQVNWLIWYQNKKVEAKV